MSDRLFWDHINRQMSMLGYCNNAGAAGGGQTKLWYEKKGRRGIAVTLNKDEIGEIIRRYAERKITDALLEGPAS